MNLGSECCCKEKHLHPTLVVLTGGPGAGKTAILELIKKYFCEHIRVIPEAASIIFGGGFPRHSSLAGRKAAQRAIYHVQREQERMALEEGGLAIALCDRGTLDGLAYWPGTLEEYLSEVGTTLDVEMSRYAAVIHLRSPSLEHGYGHSNPIRTESATEAAEVDSKLEAVWRRHPKRFLVESNENFLAKAKETIKILNNELPECCRSHRIPEIAEGNRES